MGGESEVGELKGGGGERWEGKVREVNEVRAGRESGRCEEIKVGVEGCERWGRDSKEGVCDG